MGMVFLDMAMSLDGFISGPDGQDHGLHNWYFNPSEPSREVIAELIQSIGAMVMGRGVYGVGSEQGDLMGVIRTQELSETDRTKLEAALSDNGTASPAASGKAGMTLLEVSDSYCQCLGTYKKEERIFLG